MQGGDPTLILYWHSRLSGAGYAQNSGADSMRHQASYLKDGTVNAALADADDWVSLQPVAGNMPDDNTKDRLWCWVGRPKPSWTVAAFDMLGHTGAHTTSKIEVNDLGGTPQLGVNLDLAGSGLQAITGTDVWGSEAELDEPAICMIHLKWVSGTTRTWHFYMANFTTNAGVLTDYTKGTPVSSTESGEFQSIGKNTGNPQYTFGAVIHALAPAGTWSGAADLELLSLVDYLGPRYLNTS
jgi:hypothetical protein